MLTLHSSVAIAFVSALALLAASCASTDPSSRSDQRDDAQAQLRATTPNDSTQPELPEGFWSSCSAVREYDYVTMTCGDLILVYDFQLYEATESENYLRSVVYGLESSGIEVTAFAPQTFEVTEPPLEGSQFEVAVTEEDGGIRKGRGYGVLFRAPNLNFTAALCMDVRREQPDPQCLALLRALVEGDVPQNIEIVDQTAAPEFAGRPLEVSESCRTHTGEDIRCAGSALVWNQVAPGAKAEAEEEFIALMLDSVERVGQLSEPKSQSCVVDDVETTCSTYQVRTHEDGWAVMLSAQTMVRDSRVALVCTWDTPTAPHSVHKTPYPCSEIVQFQRSNTL